MHDTRIVLASASPRRKELLGLLTQAFDVYPADIDETLCAGKPLEEEMKRLALEKAQWTADKLGGGRFVIGSDTVVVLDGQVMGKPKTPQEAQDMLRRLSGRTHRVLTSAALVCPDRRTATELSETAVTFYPLSEAEIARYVSTGEPMDKAGAYGIQGYGALLVEKIDGDYYSVVGLPAARLARMLRAYGALA